jgi:hypothetical protein
MVKQANNYLKWAFIEAPNVVVRQRHHRNWRDKYVVHLYERTLRRKGHAVAVGALARYLAESHLLGSQEGRALPGAAWLAPGGEQVTVSLRAGQARA